MFVVLLFILGGLCWVGVAFLKERNRIARVNASSDYVGPPQSVYDEPWIVHVVLVVMIGGFIGFAVSLLLSHIVYEPNYTEGRGFNIVAVADGSQTQGSFFLFGGVVEEKQKYFFYRKDGDEIRQGYIPVGSTVIVEDASPQDAWIEVRRDEQNWIWILPITEPTQYIVHVPEGAVKRQFNLDLER